MTKKKPIKNQLANPNDPIEVNGKLIDETSHVDGRQFISVPKNSEAQQTIINTKKKLADLPAPPQEMNTISVVASYTLLGIDDKEIAIATGLTTNQIDNIKVNKAYEEFIEHIIESLKENDLDTVRGLISSNSLRSAERIGELIESRNEAIALKASEANLDRDGFRPADVVEHRHKLEGGMTIEIIKKDLTQEKPLIDVTPIE